MQPRSEGVAARAESVGGAGQRGFVRAGGIGVSLSSVVIPFVKASACGNDFLLVDGADNDLANIDLANRESVAQADLARITRRMITQRMCDRYEGVGADGVEFMYPHATADVE